MNDSIQDEIARRLGASSEEIRPVLETVVQRIRQQVEHYGYARLANLGTFRGSNGSIVFEPDAGLAEAVNARFAGLDTIMLEPYDPADEDVVTPAADAESGFQATERSVTEAARDGDGTDAPDAESSSGFEGMDEGPDTLKGPHAPREEPSPPETHATPAFESSDTDGRPPFEEAVEPEASGEEADDEAFWDLERTADEHPLGPESEPSYEEADYSVIGEPASDDDDEDRIPTIAWAPVGEGPDDPERTGDAPHEGRGETARRPEEPGERTQESKGRRRASTAADRPAHAHGIQDEGPAKTVGASSRRSKKQPDPKAVWFGIGIIVIVVAAAIAFFVLPDRPTSPTEPAATQAEMPTDTAAARADAAPSPADMPPAEAGGDTAAADVQALADVDDGTPSTPLRSEEGIDETAGGYTIVVFSETSQDMAENAADTFRDQGFRTSVLVSQDDGATRYRVGVGQFETLEEATQARDDLAGGELPDDAWVRRL